VGYGSPVIEKVGFGIVFMLVVIGIIFTATGVIRSTWLWLV
jgi:hypothetical protein